MSAGNLRFSGSLSFSRRPLRLSHPLRVSSFLSLDICPPLFSSSDVPPLFSFLSVPVLLSLAFRLLIFFSCSVLLSFSFSLLIFLLLSAPFSLLLSFSFSLAVNISLPCCLSLSHSFLLSLSSSLLFFLFLHPSFLLPLSFSLFLCRTSLALVNGNARIVIQDATINTNERAQQRASSLACPFHSRAPRNPHEISSIVAVTQQPDQFHWHRSPTRG